MTEPEASETESSVATLVDEVMRGERFMWLPPGGFVMSLLIPCFCFAAVAIAYLITASLSGAHEVDAPFVFRSMGIALALTALASIGQLLVIRGHTRFRRWLRAYLLALLTLTIVLGAALLVGWFAALAPTGAGATAVTVAAIALVLCNIILQSRSYTLASAFLSLKRKYRLEAKAKAEEILRRPGSDPSNARRR